MRRPTMSGVPPVGPAIKRTGRVGQDCDHAMRAAAGSAAAPAARYRNRRRGSFMMFPQRRSKQTLLNWISTYLLKLAEQTIIRLVSGPQELPRDVCFAMKTDISRRRLDISFGP